ncbi:MAG TPA: CoA-acylating methylmalonate-semialdehyde dehydrogenase [Solirubrobacterales bacterium]|nr:CoA-acylating methylmalonate-semialdehyde dehydrogenase [Solirubrobacterales bacterium]
MPETAITDTERATPAPGRAPADGAVRRLRNYVGGVWVEPTATETLETRSPASGEVLANVPLSNAADVAAATAAARAAFPGWRATPPQQRARALFALRALVAEHQEELARLVTEDMGKTFDDAFAEVGRGIESIEAASAVPHLLKGENLEGVATGVDVEMVRQPLGVVGAITPFNFPVMIPLWFVPYALGCGNTVVLKPSEQDPLPSVRLFELIDAAGILPDGVLNLVLGAHEAVDGLLHSPEVDGISFVGSAKTARHVAGTAAAEGKRVQALGGAKNAMVAMPDADPRLLANGVTGSAFGAAGQRCLAGSLLVLVGSKEEQDTSLRTVVEAARGLTVGDGADPATDVCPLVSVDARERVEGEIEAALGDGAELVLDGRRDGGEGGAQLGPTILDKAPLDSRAVREELFGPVLTVLRVDDLDGALEVVNSSRYGNSSILFTSSGGTAREFRYGVQAGMIGVNVGVAAPIAWFPFAGWKDSIDGDLHANGHDAFEFYTRKKVVTSRWR